MTHHLDHTRLAQTLLNQQGQINDLTQERDRLRAGEEDGHTPGVAPTPGQWLRRLNEAAPSVRLETIGHLLASAERGDRCFLNEHEGRLAEERKARVAVARVRDVIADMEGITGARHWARILRTAVDGVPGPAATEATEPPAPAAPHTGLVIDRYRNDRGESAWCFRCWGTDTCDGWLSLDHYSRESAERARDRHVAEDHPPVDPPVQCWHTEAGTPCDSTVCRQPERLAAGDYGTDPREQH
ncbi:hypothetical protein ACWERY_16100 [Streptomyces sp. NPDC004082]